jgi:hypothetical protein
MSGLLPVLFRAQGMVRASWTPRVEMRAPWFTRVMSAANDARLAVPKNDRLISGVRWLATFDGHVCPLRGARWSVWNLDGEKLTGTKVEFRPRRSTGTIAASCRPSPRAKPTSASIFQSPRMRECAHRAKARFTDRPRSRTFSSASRRRVHRARARQGTRALFETARLKVRDLVSGTGRELSLDELR